MQNKIVVRLLEQTKMAAFFLIFHNDRALRREKVFLDRINPLERYADSELIARYRFHRQGITELTELVRADIERPTSRSNAIPPHIQVSFLLFLLFYLNFQESLRTSVKWYYNHFRSRIKHLFC